MWFGTIKLIMAEIPEDWITVKHKPTCVGSRLVVNIDANTSVASGTNVSACGHGWVRCTNCGEYASKKAHVQLANNEVSQFPTFEELRAAIRVG